MTRQHMALVPPEPADAEDIWLRAAVAQSGDEVIIHAAGRAEDLPRLAGVIAAVDTRAAFRQLVLDAGAGAGSQAVLAQLGATAEMLWLDAVPKLPEDVDAVLAESGAIALVLHADDHASLCCALAAARLGISIVRVGGRPKGSIGRVIARLADLLLVHSPRDGDVGGAPLRPERATVIGNPLVELVQGEARAALAAAAWRHYDLAPGGYILAVLTGAVSAVDAAETLTEVMAVRPLLLEAPVGYEVPGARVVATPSFLERLSLERAAEAIFTDSERVSEEATALGVPCYAVDGSLEPAPVEPAPASQSWDRGASRRAADALVANFARVRLTC